MFAASLLCLLVTRGGIIDRVEGGVLLVTLVLFIAYTIYVARRGVGTAEARQIAEQVEARDIDAPAAAIGARGMMVSLAILIVGIGALVAGGRLLVDGAVTIARIAGVTERVIGLTIVAGGTGAPEFATSLMAALRKRTDVAVANMIGSNIFNILGILGLTAVIIPVPVSAALVSSDILWMIGTALLLLPLMRSGARLSRGEGAFLCAVYVTYLVLLLRQ
jgi:cation:H+ antiporter